jgi:hypothetical protein
MVLLLGCSGSQDSPPEAPPRAETTRLLESRDIVLLEEIHFTAPDGGESVVRPGVYRVDEGAPRTLVLHDYSSDEGLVVQARSVPWTGAPEAAWAALVGAPDSSLRRVALMRGGGSRLEAVGFVDGIRPRATPIRPFQPPPKWPEIEVIQPDGSCAWAPGRSYDIVWGGTSARDYPYVGIALVDSERRLVTGITAKTPNDGRYRWSIPRILKSEIYYVVVGTLDLSHFAQGRVLIFPPIPTGQPAEPGAIVLFAGGSLVLGIWMRRRRRRRLDLESGGRDQG